MKARVLVCDDDKLFQRNVQQILETTYEVRCVENSEQATATLNTSAYDVLLLDVKMRTEREGIRAIPALRESHPDLVIIMCSGIVDYKVVRDALKQGATDYLAKDFKAEDLLLLIQKTLRTRDVQKAATQSDSEIRRETARHQLIGNSPSIRKLKELIEKIRTVRTTNASILIQGETGTGKEIVARMIRGLKPDGSQEPFAAVDSSTIQNSTAESRLFGYEKGAFTGADRTQAGIFEDADGGTVYFDEIANMSLEIQAKLLRVLQEKEVTRMGSNRTLQLNFRVICASNRNLEEMSRQGAFLPDLLQRLQVLPVSIPPLRERKEDIAILVNHFVEKHFPGSKRGFSEDALEYLQNYRWPGNVRELENLVVYVLTLCEANPVEAVDLPPRLRDLAPTSDTPPAKTSFYERVQDYEKEILQEAYTTQSGNISRLAMNLGMDRSHLYTKLRQYGIHTKK